MTLNTILFDLDGTLLPLDMDTFMGIFFEEIGKSFNDFMDPKELIEHVSKATKDMVENTEDRINEEIFMESCKRYIKEDMEEFKKRLDIFYDKEFLKAKEAVIDIPIIKESIKNLKQKGYKMVVATNPLFPKKAILHRIRWAGFNPEDFIHITSYEESHYCKPQIKYYEEILKKINKNPEECMMVGNNVEEDLVAGKLGMKTYLIEDFIINRSNKKFFSTYKGNYNDFYKFVNKLPYLND